MKEAIASFISLEEKRFQLTLADVDSKRTVDHAEVEAGTSRTKEPGRP